MCVQPPATLASRLLVLLDREKPTNARVAWRYRPLSDVYLVYTDRQDSQTWTQNERVLALKVTHMTAF